MDLLNLMSKYRQGVFTLNNPHKYLMESVDNIVFRSSWEKRVFTFLDNDSRILAWASEPFYIQYMKPVMVKGKMSVKLSKYYPDLYVEFIDNNGDMRKQLIEIKPEKQTRPSKARIATTKMKENYVYAINMAKFTAAQQWCVAHGIEFIVATEKTLFR